MTVTVRPKVAIVGTGGAGRSYAAVFQSEQRVDPVLFSPTGKGLQAPSCTLKSTGIIDRTQTIRVGSSWADAVDDADIAIVAINAAGYRAVLEGLAPRLRSGQVVIISAQLCFASLYLHMLLSQLGTKGVVIGAWSTGPVTSKKVDNPTGVHIQLRRNAVPVASLDPAHRSRVLQVSELLFGPRFELQDRMIALELSNLNPEIHAANMLLNFTRAENAEEWSNYGMQTRGVMNSVRASSEERRLLAERLVTRARSPEEHYHHSFGLEYEDLYLMSAKLAKQRTDLKGPTTIRTRFLYEDIPYGLHPLSLLGKVKGVQMKQFESLVTILSATCDEDFIGMNNLLEVLKMEEWAGGRLEPELSDALRLYGIL